MRLREIRQLNSDFGWETTKYVSSNGRVGILQILIVTWHTSCMCTVSGSVEIKLGSREGQIFPSILIFFPENIKYRVFSCDLSKTDPSLILALFQRGRKLLQGVETPNPRQFYPGIGASDLTVRLLTQRFRIHSKSWKVLTPVSVLDLSEGGCVGLTPPPPLVPLNSQVCIDILKK